jgi:AcrR family transcriptional regulator
MEPKNMRHTSQVRRLELLDMAAHLFSTRGFHATSMRDLALELDIKAASLYHHFNSKDQLLGEVCEIGMDQLRSSLARAVELNDTLRATLTAVITNHVVLIERYGNYLHCYQNEYMHLSKDIGEKILKKYVEFHDQIDSIFIRAIESGEARPDLNVKHARLAIIAILQFLARPDAPYNRATIGDTVAGLSEILIDGLAQHA